MAKKNKGKGGIKQVVQKAAQGPKITDELRESAKSLDEKVSAKIEEAGLDASAQDATLSPESASRFETAEKKEDVAGYLKYLRDLNIRLETLQAGLNNRREKIDADKDKLEEEREDFEKEKGEFEKKLEDYNKKDKELTEREFAVDHEMYSSVVRSLLDKMREAEQDVFSDAEKRVKELTDLHTATLDRIAEYQKDMDGLATAREELRKDLRAFKKEQARYEVQKESYEGDLRDEYEQKYLNEVGRLESDLERYKEKNERLEKEKESLSLALGEVKAAFDNEEPRDMIARINYYKEKVRELEDDLNGRPDAKVYEAKVQEIKILREKVEELLKLDREKELAELKVALASEDSLSILRMQQRSERETAAIKERHYLDQIKSLQETIQQLKDDTTKNTEAFEFASSVDADQEMQSNALLRNEPADLESFAEYVRGRMIAATDDEGNPTPFYYDLDTVRIFIAGLNMSPISILWGISGTGKTSLPREFAKALVSEPVLRGVNAKDKRPNAPFRICAIQSGWRDKMDLIGYYNTFEKKYNETEFFKALYVANQPKYRNTLFLIILDEMNLSRPEHYFADFLSLLEQPEDQRYITITDRRDIQTKSMTGGRLFIPENVRFIGTANHDETTLEFAPKTYDRSNVMELPRNYAEQGKAASMQYSISYDWLKERFSQAESFYEPVYQKFKEFIDDKDFRKLLEEKNIGIGNRFEKQAKKFITVFVASGKDNVGDLAKAADHLVTSRLLRTLKDRYELNSDSLKKFKAEFVALFELHFNGKKPVRAMELLDKEIEKKSN